MYEISFKLQHDCPFNDLSEKYPRAVIAHWCNHQKDVLEVTCDDIELFQKIQNDVAEIEHELGVRVLRKSFSATNAQLVIQNCGCSKIKSEISPILEKHNCLEMQPTIYRDGWEWYRVIAFSQGDVKRLFRALEKKTTGLEIVSRRTIQEQSVHDSFVISSGNLLGELTDKQTLALLTALNQGYYRIPKQVTTDQIAQQLGVPRTTYEEHLRKAESKVLRAITPFIHLSTSNS